MFAPRERVYSYCGCLLSGTQSCLRLVDVDGDGRQDILLGMSMGMDMDAEKMTRTVAKDFCKETGIGVCSTQATHTCSASHSRQAS